MPLEIQSPAPDIHVAALVGVLDSAAGQEMVASIKQTVRGRNESIVLDCTRLRQMDMGGFKGLLALDRWGQQNEARIVIAGMSEEMWQAMIVTNHCSNMFDSRPSVPAALQSLGLGLGLGAAPAPQAPPAGSYHDYPEVDPYVAPPAAPAYGAAPARDPWAEMNAVAPVRGEAAPGPWDQPAAGGSYPPLPIGHPDYNLPIGHIEQPPMHDQWAQPESPAPTAGGGDWDAQPAWGGALGTDDAWVYERQAGGHPVAQRPKAASVPFWKKPLTIIIAGSLVLMLVLAWFLIGWMKVPVITVLNDTVTLTIGTAIEGDGITVNVENGDLIEERTKPALPEGLSFQQSGDDASGVKIYKLDGQPKGPATHWNGAVVAIRGSKTVQHPISVTLKDRELEWAKKQSLSVTASPGRTDRLPVVSYAPSATAVWTPDWQGMKLTKQFGSEDSWELSGPPPTTAGAYSVEVTATSRSGKTQTNKFTVTVAAPPPPPPPTTISWSSQEKIELVVGQPVPSQLSIGENMINVSHQWRSGEPGGVVVRPDAASTKAFLEGTPVSAGGYELQVTATAAGGGQPDTRSFSILVKNVGGGGGGGGDQGMIRFMTDRINSAGDHFTEDEKNNLRSVVQMLDRPQNVVTVKFENGVSGISASQIAEIKAAFKDPLHAEVLNDPDCQIFVVGYASMSGSLATNKRLSMQRALAVNKVIQSIRGHGAELCGDYGPTDQLGRTEDENRAVEVYAGILKFGSIPGLKESATKFKDSFNRNHGLRD